MMSNTYTNRRRRAVLEAQQAARIERERIEANIRRAIRQDASKRGR